MKLNLHRSSLQRTTTTTTSLVSPFPHGPHDNRWQELANTHTQPRLSGCLLLRQTHLLMLTAIVTYLGHQSPLNASLPSQTASLKIKIRIISDNNNRNNMSTQNRLSPPSNRELINVYFTLHPLLLATSLQALIHLSLSVPMLPLITLHLAPHIAIPSQLYRWMLMGRV